MKKNIWCDSMFCENNSAWMVGSALNALFKFDFDTKTYKYITDFPNVPIMGFRVNQLCMKIQNNIFSFPDCGECIWIYNIDNNNFDKIMIDNPDKVRIGIYMAFKINSSIYAIASGLKQIIEIGVNKKEILGIYSIEEYMQNSLVNCEGCVVHENIYFTIPEKNIVCEFSAKTKKVTVFDISKNIMPQTICYDGANFWLTGKTKEVVKWNREMNSLTYYTNIPKSVGMFEIVDGIFFENTSDTVYQRPLFRWSMNVRNKIWFIPFTANKVIYLDQATQEICACDIESEYEDGESWSRIEKVKYRFECVFLNRYIFLYSYKNKNYLVIDAKTDVAFPVDIVLEKESREEIFKQILVKHDSIIETDATDILDISQILKNTDGRKEKEDIGKRIYQQGLDVKDVII